MLSIWWKFSRQFTEAIKQTLEAADSSGESETTAQLVENFT
jgi:hypothetical protein